MQTRAEWVPGPEAWKLFIYKHPELGYKPGRMSFHNFLRYYREHLVRKDAIRLAKRRFWIAHVDRFCREAFACATGQPLVQEVA